MSPDFEWWKTADGTRVRVRFMSHAHITNTIAMLGRYIRALKNDRAMAEPPHYAPEEGQGVAWDMWDGMIERAERWIKAFRAELRRRERLDVDSTRSQATFVGPKAAKS
jgi:hypothetical protein